MALTKRVWRWDRRAQDLRSVRVWNWEVIGMTLLIVVGLPVAGLVLTML